GVNHDLSWHNVDREFNDFAIRQLDNADLLLFGRVTYDLMAGYWPTSGATKDDPIVADKMNSIRKIVFSRTLTKAEWNNTKLVKENIPQEIAKLKQQPGKEIGIFGSGNLAASLIPLDIIDEYRIIINPVILGSGKALFNETKVKLRLKLLTSKTFQSGNVFLTYAPSK
ncbi:MAG TPA: dihydrofolate reductase family protein, partial [Bacteroidota bacterium]|nr:dihydrofolate reductase family protein [Bacteroidota bacterium]